MGLINEVIKTKLTYKEIALLRIVINQYKTDSDPEVFKEAEDIINRLEKEMFSYPKSNFT